jgi:cytochrome b subunit of formate dehydrogenase
VVETGRKFLRLTLNERVQHINLAINFTILVITGFALKYPEAFWVSPITDVPGGMTLRGLLHRLSGVATVTLSLYHVLYVVFTKRGRGIVVDMFPRLKDLSDAWETLKNNLFIHRPARELKMGRFNFREKAEYLGMIWGTIVMTVTGAILWWEVEWLKFFPKWTYEVARAVHFYEAVLATLTILVWHFYSVLLNPDVYPMNWAWITGDMTEHEMKVEHGLELEKILAGEEKTGPGPGRTSSGGYGETGRNVKDFSARDVYGSVQDLNRSIKDWKGN